MDRFSIVYRGLSDPSSDDERLLVSLLNRDDTPATVLDSMPGLFLVEGNARAVERLLRGCDHWAVAESGSVSVPSPRRPPVVGR
jgi:hypothetical protein